MDFASLIRRFLLLIVLMGFSAGSPAGENQAEGRESRQHQKFLEQRTTIIENLRFELHKTSDWCQDNGLPEAAAATTQLAVDLTTDSHDTRPARTIALPLSPALPETERQWRMQTRRVREDRARELYALARKAQRARLPSIAYMLIQDVLRFAPDHGNARAVLGQQRFNDPLRENDDGYAGEWVSRYEAEMRGGRTPHILDERFGWIPRAHLARYEEGMRPWKRGWHSKEKDDLIRRDFKNAWQIESEHFLVKTNVSLEEGVLLSRQLETYHEWLRQNLAAFFDTPAKLRARFEEAGVSRRRPSRSQKRMEVRYYATRDEYRRVVRDKVPPDIPTNGLYWQPDSRCYFFKNEQREGLDTLFHEATHQILDVPSRQARVTAARALARKNRRRRQDWILGGESGFWLIEGLACYFESFEVVDGAVSVGRPDHIRFVAAQQRLLRDNFYVPLETFCRLGKDQFQHHPNVPQFYSQASGVAHFLMHYDDGRYRDDLVRLLDARYRPDSRNPQRHVSLSDITGVPFAQLDQQYREHMEDLALQVRRQAAPPVQAASP